MNSAIDLASKGHSTHRNGTFIKLPTMTDASFYRKTEEYYNFASSLSETHSIRKTLKTNKTFKAIKSISSFKHHLNVLQELASTSLLILVLLVYTISNIECRSKSAEEIFNNKERQKFLIFHFLYLF